MRRFWEKNIVFLSLIPVLAVMLLIFGFSSQNGEESGAMSAQITAFVIRVFRPEFARLDAAAQAALLEKTMHLVRKGAHFSEFAALGFFLLGHFRALELKEKLRRPALFSAITGILYAVSDELHQGFVGGRSPAVLDVGIDSAGVLCGLLVMALLLRLRRSRKRES